MINKQRAIEILEVQKSYCADINIDAIIAYNIAINAIKQQIAYKPKQIYLTEEHMSYICSCGSIISTKIRFTLYCDVCGQRLDWGFKK